MKLPIQADTKEDCSRDYPGGSFFYGSGCSNCELSPPPTPHFAPIAPRFAL